MDRNIGFGFTNSMGTGGVLDVCLCLGCSGVGGVGGEWVGAWTRVCISASYRVFVCDRYRLSRLGCAFLSDLDL